MTPTGPTRIGIYGGTFNPIHAGHLKAAREVMARLGLARVIFVPSALPPHKSSAPDDPIAQASDRLAWVELAIADEPDFTASAIELDRAGASYTIETLETLAQALAPARLVFIIGHDAFVEMGTWRSPEAILALVDLAVVARPPVDPGPLADWLPNFARGFVEVSADGRSAQHLDHETRIDVLEIGALDISASEIRSDLAAGRPVDGRLPDAVLASIRQSGYYSGMQPPHTQVDNPGEASEADREDALTSDVAVDPATQPTPGAQPEPLDAAQREKLSLIVDATLERNAQDPVALDVRSLTSYTDCVIVVSGNSQRQLRAICDSVVKALKAAGDAPLGVEGGGDATWMLIDANDVIVHVFQPDSRGLFDIEGLWTDAPRIALDLRDTERASEQSPVPPRIA